MPRRDSNPNKQNQNLRCYHYTTRQTRCHLPYWRGRRGSNPQPPDRQSSALTNCATTPLFRKVMIVYHISMPSAIGFFKKIFHFFFSHGIYPHHLILLLSSPSAYAKIRQFSVFKKIQLLTLFTLFRRTHAPRADPSPTEARRTSHSFRVVLDDKCGFSFHIAHYSKSLTTVTSPLP